MEFILFMSRRLLGSLNERMFCTVFLSSEHAGLAEFYRAQEINILFIELVVSFNKHAIQTDGSKFAIDAFVTGLV